MLLPFHAFLTVWLSSSIDHYTLLRLWKEFLLLVISIGASYLLVTDKSLRQRIFASRLPQLIALYLLLSLLWGVVAYSVDKVTLKALGYGLLVNSRFLIFFLSLWIIATKSQWLKKAWPKLLFMPAAVVIFIGLLQKLVLPYDVLKHFGYSPETIFPYQTINRDINYTRIMSTLRGANPLGAYLVLILSGLAVYFIKFIKSRRLLGILGFIGLAALFFSYSRSAWIGMAFSALFLAWIYLGARARKFVLVIMSGILAVGLITAVTFWNNPTFQNYVFHTSDRSTINDSSNEEHLSAFREGIKDMVSEPLGKGVGTAGPASIYNDGNARLPENYFIQIAQEIGWVGLAAFLVINFLVVRELWFRRSGNLARILLVSFVGITAVNLVSHAWTDDTLAYIWWGLTGIALAPAILTDRKHKQHAKNHKKKP